MTYDAAVSNAGPSSSLIEQMSGASDMYVESTNDNEMLRAPNTQVALMRRSFNVQMTETEEEELVKVGSPDTDMSLTAAEVVTGANETVITSGRLQRVSETETVALAAA